jgi:hypothetical protein
LVAFFRLFDEPNAVSTLYYVVSMTTPVIETDI